MPTLIIRLLVSTQTLEKSAEATAYSHNVRTLSTHGTETFRRVLVDPSEEAMLKDVSKGPKQSSLSSFDIPCGMNGHICRALSAPCQSGSLQGSQHHTQGAFISGIFARGASPIELDTTDTADFVFWHIPSPRCHRVPLLDRDLHRGGAPYVLL